MQDDLEDWSAGQFEFLMAWHAMGRAQRKQLSHRGAIPAFAASDPAAWTNEEGHKFFDPGNWVYASAVKFACPRFIEASGISNHEVLGDVLEALLGYACDKSACGCHDCDAELRAP